MANLVLVRAGVKAWVMVALLGLAACSPISPKDKSDAWPEYTQPEAQDFALNCQNDLAEAWSRFRALEVPEPTLPDSELLDAINELDIVTNRIGGSSSLYHNVHPSAEVRSAADFCQRLLVELGSEISLSRPLYQRLSQVDLTALNTLDTRFVENMLKAYQRSGVDQDEESRQRIRELNEQINLLGQEFGRNIREDVRQLEVESADLLAGLPQDYIDSRRSETGSYIITTEYPDYQPVMQYAENDQLRYDLYKLFRQRGYPANDKVLHELLTRRYEQARLLGYRDYAQYVTEEMMIKTPEQAQTFIDRIAQIADARARADYQLLLTRLQQIDPAAERVGDWQKTYLEELIKLEQFNIDSREVRQYFHYDNVRQGIFDLTEKLFGVTIVSWETDVWHDSVSAHEIRDGDKIIGRFYLDMHPRSGKYSHAAAFTLQTGVLDRQLPIVSLVCNFPGGEGSSGYLGHSDVKTFLHEFGHLLHAIFGGHQPWSAMSGIRTEWDFVEAPSQMLEEWIWDAETLATFARNAEGEVIPAHLVENMNAARDVGRGLFVQHQMYYAALSLNYYNRDPADVNLIDMMRVYQGMYSPFPHVEDTYFHTSFGHLYGYSAIYYTYMWSLVIASDMFSEFLEHGMSNTEVAQRYRDKVLAPGGSRDAADLVEDFLGRPYSFDAFAEMISNGK